MTRVTEITNALTSTGIYVIKQVHWFRGCKTSYLLLVAFYSLVVSCYSLLLFASYYLLYNLYCLHFTCCWLLFTFYLLIVTFYLHLFHFTCYSLEDQRQAVRGRTANSIRNFHPQFASTIFNQCNVFFLKKPKISSSRF